MKNWIFLTFLLLLNFASMAQSKTLRIAVAASLINPLKEISAEFENEYPINIEWIPGASGTLTNQIMHGAPFDILISANEKYTDLLNEKSLLSDDPIPIALGSLVLWSRLGLDNFPEEIQNNESIKSIAIAQPELAPYGAAAKQYLVVKGLWPSIKKKIVFANNISLVNQYISSSSTDVVITSLSSKYDLDGRVEGYWYAISDFSSTLRQTAGIVKFSNAQKEAKQFLQYLQSHKSKSILTKYGYQLP